MPTVFRRTWTQRSMRAACFGRKNGARRKEKECRALGGNARTLSMPRGPGSTFRSPPTVGREAGVEPKACRSEERDGRTETWPRMSDRKKMDFPFTCIEMNEMPKLGLLLNAVDPELGGIAVLGAHGTGKSVLARSLLQIMPPIETMRNSWCNADPDKPQEWESDLSGRIGRASLEDAVRESYTSWRPCPFVQVPLGVTEDMLLGSVDVEKSLERGEPVFQPGILARAHRGILYVDDMNLMEEGILNILMNALGSGINVVEREGISITHPCKPVLVATLNTDEGEVREHIMDQIAIHTCTDSIQNLQQRVMLSITNADFADRPLELYLGEEDRLSELKLQVLCGRELLPNVHMTREQILYIAKECAMAAIEGQRGEIFACKTAKAIAALSGRTDVQSGDLTTAVALVVAPRATFSLPSEQTPSSPPPTEPQEQDQGEERSTDENEKKEDQPESVPSEFVFDPSSVALDPKLLLYMKAMQKVKGKAGKTKAKLYNLLRGRYVKPAFVQGKKVSRLAIDATLRAAAPAQKRRREARKAKPNLMSRFRRERGDNPEEVVWIDKYDLRNKLLVKKSGNLVIFVVDSSGSMALNRMDAAKGAAIGLLSQAYRNRDMVSLICFGGRSAQIVLPPSSSVQMAKKRLEKLPCGGASPLSHGIALAVRTALNARKAKNIGRVIFVVITDGRANIPLSESLKNALHAPSSIEMDQDKESKVLYPHDKEKIKQEVLSLLSKLPGLGIDVLVVDTESKFISSGFARDIANASKGTYFYLPRVSSQGLSSFVSGA